MKYENKTLLMKYVKGIYKFEEYIKDINTNLGTELEPHRGYLVNLERIDELKKKINYDNNKKYLDNYKDDPVDNEQNEKYAIDEIEFRDSNYLLNMILNGNKYILINRDLWKLISKDKEKNKACILYKINYNTIRFQLDDQKELIFSKFENNLNLISSEFFIKWIINIMIHIEPIMMIWFVMYIIKLKIIMIIIMIL